MEDERCKKGKAGVAMRLTRKRDMTLARIESQLMIIEKTVDDLLARVDIDELTSAERLNLVVKFLTQQNRVLALKNSLLLTLPEQDETPMLSTLMRQMRGDQMHELLEGGKDEGEEGEESDNEAQE